MEKNANAEDVVHYGKKMVSINLQCCFFEWIPIIDNMICIILKNFYEKTELYFNQEFKA
jgi:hypothetical protein